ncbi:hypothetical protein L1887_12482 [Cichorium endivia]|nr:hypothetical protein L1887_12482 [Cichorium endivia]
MELLKPPPLHPVSLFCLHLNFLIYYEMAIPEAVFIQPIQELHETALDMSFRKLSLIGYGLRHLPKFRFLRDAKDKLQRRKEIGTYEDDYDDRMKDDENGHFITLIVSKNKEIETLRNFADITTKPWLTFPVYFAAIRNNNLLQLPEDPSEVEKILMDKEVALNED